MFRTEVVMRTKISRLAAGVVLATMLAGCVAPPPRPNTAYYNDRSANGANYNSANYDRGGYYDRDSSYDRSNYDHGCTQCGRVTDIERVYAHDRNTSGGGAVLGAVVGGLLGSTVGKGDGRTAATVAGAVAGGFAGNAVEANNNGRGYNAFRFYVSLDDGRSAVVTQYDNPGFRPGDRVMIRNDHLVVLR
ncbi:MAG TPA: glycine zipper 2TM domain-containing protein [Rhodanobacteraceae bacterium]|nr:glycine zipper 2TM domain-containing protein [Rhodanobacteraceae bacterium]